LNQITQFTPLRDGILEQLAGANRGYSVFLHDPFGLDSFAGSRCTQ
jgi:hypothetical protein